MFCLGDDPRFLTALIETLHIKLSGCKSVFFFLFPTLSQLLLMYKKKNNNFSMLTYSLCDLVMTRKYCSLLSPSQIEKAGVWGFGTSLRQTFVLFFIHLFFSQLLNVLKNRKPQSNQAHTFTKKRVKEISTSSRHTASMKGGQLNTSIAILPHKSGKPHIVD